MGLVWRVPQEHLYPPLVRDVTALLMPSPSDWYVTHGFRSMEEQAGLYAKYKAGGPRAAPPGLSAHNYGLAVDVVLDTSPASGLQPSWDTEQQPWRWLFSALEHHATLLSGVGFRDGDHIEWRHWSQYKQWAQDNSTGG